MSGGVGGSGDATAAGEDDSVESSLQAFQTMPNDFRSALDDFRANWQKELKQKQGNESLIQKAGNQAVSKNLLNDSPTVDETEEQALAKSLFHKAVELEQRGKVYDAIPFYRKAVQIEPNIEYKYYEHEKEHRLMEARLAQNAVGGGVANKDKETADAIEDDVIDDLYEKFQMDLSHDYHNKLIMSNRDPGIITTEMHISELPSELLLYILRWIVSSQLDMRSLEQCAAVCKGMYLLARSEELWRSACVRVWGHNVGTLSHAEENEEKPDVTEQCPIIPRYSTWRQMFIERERVLFNGCYISKTTYLRMGENSFQDQYYRPVQLVEYYRYIRFLPDGNVYMMTSADDPQQGVTKLKNLQQLRPDILKGHYRLFGSTVTIVLSKQQPTSKFITNTSSSGPFSRHRRGSTVYDEAAFNSTKYCIEMRILNTSKRKFAQLIWIHYSIVQMRNKHETTSEFDLTSSKYPPLWFSPVRSYHLDADVPLG